MLQTAVWQTTNVLIQTQSPLLILIFTNFGVNQIFLFKLKLCSDLRKKFGSGTGKMTRIAKLTPVSGRFEYRIF